MASKVVLLSEAKKDVALLPVNMRRRIADAIDDLQGFPEVRGGIKKLKPPFDGYRKRVGDCRILFDYEGDTVFVHRIKNRRDAYR